MQRMSSKDEQMLCASVLFDGQCRQMSQGDFELLASDEVRTHFKHWSLIGSALRHELPSKVDPAFASKVMARIESSDMAQTQAETSDELPSMLRSKAAFRSGLSSYARNHQQTSAVGAYEEEQSVGAYEHSAVGAYETSAVGAYEHKNVGAYENEQAVGAYEQPVSKVGPYVANETENQPLDMAQPTVSKQKAGGFSLKRVYVFASQIAIAASVAVVAVVGLQTYNASDLSVENPASTAYTNNTAIGGLSLASYQNSDSDVLMQLNNQLPKKQLDSNGNNEMQAELKKQQEEEIKRINLYVQGYVFDTAAND